MIRVHRPSGLLFLLLATNCQQTVTPPPLRSLAQSGALSLVCRDMTTGQGSDIRGCPDAYATPSDGRHTLLMVTQGVRGEVAVIDMHTRIVLDEDPTVPGTEFLPIGANPVSIVSTPGGASTFVATAEPGREAIFALPTSCVVAPANGQPQRDLTQWSACKLPSTPGAMVLLTDTSLNAVGEFRHTCDGDAADSAPASKCPADWDAEQQIEPAGRRKLLVALPEKGGLAMLDARQLFDRVPGTFKPCTIERWLPLSATVPTGPQQQAIPSDFLGDATCQVTPRYSFGPTSDFHVQPAGISLSNGRLYVADLGVPLLHVVDVSNPCDPHELPPFLPSSFDEPTRPVFTSSVAVSDVTLDNKRYVYAVDYGKGSLMAFDASDGATQQAPLLRPGSPFLPFEAPDRIYTNLQNASVKDLLFITHDVPIVNQPNQSLTTRVVCDPTPTASSPTADYRTSSDYTRGASPTKLRGIFAVVALSDGHIGVVDVDDWDAPCRRPIVGNTAPKSDPPKPDWRGCQGDTADSYISNGTQTASYEASCHVFERHHARSGRFIANNSTVGVSAPSLQTFPTLTSINGNIATGGSSRSVANPRMVAVPFAPPPSTVTSPPVSTVYPDPPHLDYSEVYVGTSQYYVPLTPIPALNLPPDATLLDNDPATATSSSLLLPQVDPRAYLPSENFSVTYEGRLFDDRTTGLLSNASSTVLTLSDPDANFCDQGVQDSDASIAQAKDFLSAPTDSQTAVFGAAYSDILQITQDFTDSDPYWVTPDGSACANNGEGIAGIAGCRNYFGITNNFNPTREWLVTEAYQDHLVFQPIPGNLTTKTDPETIAAAEAVAVANLHCCFPGTVLYTVRSGHQWLFRGQQPMNNIVVGQNLRCTVAENCDVRKQLLRNRVIEISSSNTNCPSNTDITTCTCTNTDKTGQCSIGPSSAADTACIVSDNNALDPTTYTSNAGTGTSCIFNSLKARFAIYRGLTPSIRDMSFTWQVTGGFVPFDINLANHLTGSAVLPQSMTPAPNLDALFVVDSVSGGVFELVLDPFTINGDPYL